MILRLENLAKSYATGDRALQSIDLEIPHGQIVAVIGPSGAGKSTLIRCINRLVEPTSGRILFHGEDVTSVKGDLLRQVRRRMGMIFQSYALIDRLTVMENVLSGRLATVGFLDSWLRRFPPDAISRAYELLGKVGLEGFADKRADALSGGQRQRVGIARALIQEPDLLLVDEPTASLDPKTARQIMLLLCDLCRERNLAALINIHDVSLAQRYADRIIGLRAGDVVFDGPANELSSADLTRIYGDGDWSPKVVEAIA